MKTSVYKIFTDIDVGCDRYKPNIDTSGDSIGNAVSKHNSTTSPVTNHNSDPIPVPNPSPNPSPNPIPSPISIVDKLHRCEFHHIVSLYSISNPNPNIEEDRYMYTSYDICGLKIAAMRRAIQLIRNELCQN